MTDKDFEGEFRRRFRTAREAAGWRQEDVASELGVSQQTVAKLEGEGQRKHVGLNEAAAYAKVLGVSLESLLGLDSPSIDRDEVARRYEEATEALEEEHTRYDPALKSVADLEQQLVKARRDLGRIEREISHQGLLVWQLGELLGVSEKKGLSRPSLAQERFALKNFPDLSEDEDHGEHQEA